MKKLLIATSFLLAASSSIGQGVFGVQTEYSKYKLGAGFFGGVYSGNSYIGLNTHIPFTSQRKAPVGASIEYGYLIEIVQPFVEVGYETSGNEAVSAKEGTKGVTYGGGINVIINHFKIQGGVLNNNKFISIGFFGKL
jgi:hypothetical protein